MHNDSDGDHVRLTWTTDIHLGHADDDARAWFVEGVVIAQPDLLLIGGDIGEADSVTRYLDEIARRMSEYYVEDDPRDGSSEHPEKKHPPIYFVLGNHDYYGSSIGATRERVRKYVEAHDNITWLTEAGVVHITDTTALIGHDGWPDGRLGDYYGSRLLVSDIFQIKDFNPWLSDSSGAEAAPDNLVSRLMSDVMKRRRLERMKELGDEAAAYIEKVLPQALESHEQVVLLTHVPPFKEASWHKGKPSDDDGLPYFASKAMGDTIRSVMADHRHESLIVLCGHTHSAGEAVIAPNIEVRTGWAKYGRPDVQLTLNVE